MDITWEEIIKVEETIAIIYNEALEYRLKKNNYGINFCLGPKYIIIYGDKTFAIASCNCGYPVRNFVDRCFKCGEKIRSLKAIDTVISYCPRCQK